MRFVSGHGVQGGPPCPHCGMVLNAHREPRFGVDLPHFRARLVDAVRRAGRDGIHKDDLLAIMYQHTRGPVSYWSLYSAIRRTNQSLRPAGKRIAGHTTLHTWRLVDA